MIFGSLSLRSVALLKKGWLSRVSAVGRLEGSRAKGKIVRILWWRFLQNYLKKKRNRDNKEWKCLLRAERMNCLASSEAWLLGSGGGPKIALHLHKKKMNIIKLPLQYLFISKELNLTFETRIWVHFSACYRSMCAFQTTFPTSSLQRTKCPQGLWMASESWTSGMTTSKKEFQNWRISYLGCLKWKCPRWSWASKICWHS